MAAAAVIQRPTRGSRISSFYPVKKLPALSSLDSAFQLQEYISLLIRLDVHDVDAIVSIPDKGIPDDKEKEKADEKEGDAEKKDSGVDEACWIYEQLRRLAQDLSHPLITMLQQECTRASCPEMKAGEWLYLCVAHGNDGAMEQCCAIDYILHTLDSATALLNSPRAFPSRLSIPATSHRHFSSLARRLGRIFAHAYFHHREAFEQAEAESSLYARFLALTSKFDLVPTEFLVIPPRVIGRENDHSAQEPRLRGAAIDVNASTEEDVEDEDERLWDRSLPTNIRTKSPPGLGIERNPSPARKGMRTRTDTMVHSEAFSVAEELARAEANAAVERREEPTAGPGAADEDDVPFITVESESGQTSTTPDTSLEQDVPTSVVEDDVHTEEPAPPETSVVPPAQEPTPDPAVQEPEPEQQPEPEPQPEPQPPAQDVEVVEKDEAAPKDEPEEPAEKSSYAEVAAPSTDDEESLADSPAKGESQGSATEEKGPEEKHDEKVEERVEEKTEEKVEQKKSEPETVEQPDISEEKKAAASTPEEKA